jgi:predicted nucleic acid-binding protein
MYLVDTNIFLEVMLSRRRRDECKRFLKMLRDGTISGTVSDFSIHSIMVLLDSLKRHEKLKAFLASLTGYRGLVVHQTSIAEEVRAVELTEEKKLDMDDAVQYAVALSIGAEAIVSFDRDFNNLEIPRVEPADIIGRRKDYQ